LTAVAAEDGSVNINAYFYNPNSGDKTYVFHIDDGVWKRDSYIYSSTGVSTTEAEFPVPEAVIAKVGEAATPSKFTGYGQYVAISYAEDNYIVVIDLISQELVKEINPKSRYIASGAKVLNLGPIMSSKLYEDEDEPVKFKLSYVGTDSEDDTVSYLNEVHFMLSQDYGAEAEDHSIFEVNRAITFTAENAFPTEYYFTNSGSSLVYSESAEAFVPVIYLQGSFD